MSSKTSSQRIPGLELLLGVLLIPGCLLGGQTGTENNERDTGNPTGETDLCQEEGTRLAFEETSPLGFAASELMANLATSYATDLAWRAPTPDVSFGPEQGIVAMSIEIVDVGEASFVHSTPLPVDGAEPALAPACGPERLDVEVTMRLTTESGALSETFPAVLRATDARSATFSANLALSDLAGTFEVTLSGGSTTELLVSGALTREGTAGKLSGLVEEKDGNVASQGSLDYGSWPAENPCSSADDALAVPVPLETALDGHASAADALALLDEAAGARLLWSSGESTALALDVTTGANQGCLVLADPSGPTAPTLTVPVQIAATTEDGRLESALEGTLSPEGSSARLRAGRVCEEATGPASFSACGISGFDAEGFRGVMLFLDATLDMGDAAPRWGGGLRILGLAEPEICTDDESCPGGASTPIETGTLENE